MSDKLYVLESYTRIPNLNDSGDFRLHRTRIFHELEFLNFLIEVALCDMNTLSVSDNEIVVDESGERGVIYSLDGRTKRDVDVLNICSDEHILVDYEIRDVHLDTNDQPNKIAFLIEKFRRGFSVIDCARAFRQTFPSDGGGVFFIVDIRKLFDCFKSRWAWIINNGFHNVAYIDEFLNHITQDGKDEFDKITIIQGDKITVQPRTRS